MNNKKHTVSYLAGLSAIALALAFMIVQYNNGVLAQQNSSTPSSSSNNKTMTITVTPNKQQQSPFSMSSSSQNWTGSISLFSPIIDAFKSKIHTTLNDATTNAIKAVAGGSNSSAVAAFIHPEGGFLVYDVFVLDSSNNIHRVIVDPGNGKVLSTQRMSIMDMMTMAHPSMGMMMGGPEMMMQHGMMGGPPHGMMMGTQSHLWP
ncbi:MAG TPA: PepSY domain-containing protein [Nitrososphaeraceae archaeon]|nr:PepSY domain-containing protein [Nitrososphaeraceae archaeon]